ncbi:MAG: tryptophan synthase subunit alpha [Cyclobacteriaceae bacterium]|nr:tryptophan synthase subunit alpha [Cyclobacteriaceae bacterium]UYN85661.1 MAG: tryptophan synthase subunit alpha [Cyclobacteriaceae bacterium]
MNRIDALFQQKKDNILSVFFTAGFPTLHDTVEIAKQLQLAGVDMIEIGIPFSDPIADGPVIQQSSKQAIDNGMTVKLLLEQVKEIRKTVSMPIILMGYLNPVMQYGMDRFFADAATAGVDGLILPDMPFDEFERNYKDKMEELDLQNIFLISPTTSDERIQRIDQASRGFIYAVSSSSTTGSRNEFSADQLDYFQRLRDKQLNNPFLIGFGISNRQTFSTACQYGAGVIVGSAFIKVLSKSTDLVTDISTFIRTLKS